MDDTRAGEDTKGHIQQLHWAGRIWEYLTKRWLRLTVATHDPNRGR